MAAVFDAGPATRGPRVLLVLLPGTGDTPADLLEHGLVRMVRERGIAADVVIADAHYGYYRTRQVVQRLWPDVITPALARGYDGIWLAGVSIGGLGALLSAADAEPVDHPPVVGVLAIAPVVADAELLAQVEAAGGLASWAPPVPNTQGPQRLLAWLRGYLDPRLVRPQLYVGVGRDDKLLQHARLLGALLPADHVVELAGAHDWDPWLAIWAQLLDRAPLPRIVP
jgi:hypothetical protein